MNVAKLSPTMHSPIRIAAALGIAAALAASGLGAARGAPASPLTAPRVAALTVPGLTPPTGIRDLGPATGTTRVSLLLAGRDQPGLAAVALGGHGVVSSADYLARFAPAPATVAAVTGWAQARGLHVDSVSPDRLLVTVSGPVSRIGAAFGTVLHRVSRDGGTTTAPVTAGALPSALGGKVRAVVGLTATTMHHSATARPADVGALTPGQVATFYQVPATPTGSHTNIGIVTNGDLTQVISDLHTFESTFGLPTVNPIVVNTGPASNDTSGRLEYDLDTQYSTAMAGAVHQLYLYNAPSLLTGDVIGALDRLVADGHAQVGSISIDFCETVGIFSGDLLAGDAILQEAAAKGLTIFNASGDLGPLCFAGFGGVPTFLPGVNYPASSPFVVAVGGTTIDTLSGSGGGRESAWSGSGGGVSLVEGRPAYQAKAGGSSLGLDRGVPDVALDADPATGVTVINNGQRATVGGTSAGAPMWAGFWARAESAHGNALPFANPILYRLAATFNDVTNGLTPLPATRGWDYATGLGTPNVAALIAKA